MKVLIAVKGAETEEYLRRVAALAPLREAQLIILAHVIDAGARSGVELGRERYFGRRTLGGDRSLELTAAEEARAGAALQFAHAALTDAGIDDARLSDRTLRGKPNETLRDLAEQESIDLIVVGARAGKPGPHSLGKTARFLVDHAPRAALLVR
jgi:nucleotide-binding universal stress UspA family protein